MCVISMAISKTTTSLAEKVNENKGIIATALILWGLSSLFSGIVGIYTNAIIIRVNSAAALYLLAQPIINLVVNVFNLLFGLALISIGGKIRNQ